MKNVAKAKLDFCSSWNLIKPKQKRLLLIASAKNRHNLGMVNGKNVNGISIGEAPFMKKSSTDRQLLIKENIGPDKQGHACEIGRFVEDRHVYRQTFIIRSYEIGPDKTATMETLMNLLQVGLWLIGYIIR